METLSVLTLNIRFGLARDGINAWENRKDHFPAFFQKVQPDFICLQEVNDFQADFLHSLLVDYQSIGRRHPAPPFWQNNLIFFKHPWRCLHAGHFYLSHTPLIPSRFADSCWPRQLTLGHFQKEALEVGGVATHFDFTELVQLQSGRLLFEFLGTFAPHLPVIVAGDFNCEPASPLYQLLTADEKALSKDGLTRPANQAPFKDVLKPPFPGTRHAFDGQNRGQHLDWLLYRGKLEPVYAEVLQDSGAAALSDHFPVVAKFRQSYTLNG